MVARTASINFLTNLDKNHSKKEKRLEIIKPIKNLSASKLIHQTKLGTPGRNNEQQFTRCKINLNPNIRIDISNIGISSRAPVQNFEAPGLRRGNQSGLHYKKSLGSRAPEKIWPGSRASRTPPSEACMWCFTFPGHYCNQPITLRMVR